MTPEEARYVLQILRADPTGVTRREAEALDVLLAATDPARLPRLLAPGEEIPPGCTASLRAAIVSGPAAPPSAEASGPYTRAQFAAAVDEAHGEIHVFESLCPAMADHENVRAAHDALHRVGAGLERVDCATADPEAQRLLADLLEAGQREIPCGHKVEDLIYGVSEIGRPPVTKCGACLAALPKREPAPSRSFLPQGCTSEQIATAAGVAARELVAEHGAPVGTLVEVRLVRRGGQAKHADTAPERPTYEHVCERAWAVSERLRDAQARLDKARAEFRTYHYPEVPPDRLIRELVDAENELARLRGGA